MLSECGSFDIKLLVLGVSLKHPGCVRRDAADASWDIWYDQAKQFAQGSLPGGGDAMAEASSELLKTLLLAWPGAPDRYFTGSVSDDYTIE